jgi:hypothetical protein
MTMRSGRGVIALTVVLGVLGCTRDNPSFGDDGASASEGGATEATSAGSFTGGATDSASGGSQTTAVDTGSEGGDSGDTGSAGFCGDGIVDRDEECDKGEGKNSNVGPCKLDCTVNFCGDGFVGPGEACDQPKDTAEELCTHDCTLPTCGNGMLDRMEGCDPSAPGTGDTCTPICTLNVCGDMFPLGDEECDDGNLETTDSCIDCATAFCGDGFIREGDEQCEGNLPLETTCMELGFFGGEPGCANCLIDEEGCHNCGDGSVQDSEGEQCDPGDPAGPSLDGTFCQNLGWIGDGEVTCTESCQVNVMGNCCVASGGDCVPNAGSNGFCCSDACDQMTNSCGG